MNKTNIKRAKALGLALLTTITLSACVAQAPSTEESQNTSSKYPIYVLLNVNGTDCRVAAKIIGDNYGYIMYRLEDGTIISVSTATGELLNYDIDSTEINKLIGETEKESDKQILTLD